MAALLKVDPKITIALDPELLKSVKAKARPAGVRPAALITRAIRNELEQAEELRAVLKARKRGGKTITWEQVKKNLGLNR